MTAFDANANKERFSASFGDLASFTEGSRQDIDFGVAFAAPIHAFKPLHHALPGNQVADMWSASTSTPTSPADVATRKAGVSSRVFEGLGEGKDDLLHNGSMTVSELDAYSGSG